MRNAYKILSENRIGEDYYGNLGDVGGRVVLKLILNMGWIHLA
jgi:hypothetical protein